MKHPLTSSTGVSLDLSELRKIAEAATQGDWPTHTWINEHDGSWVAAGPIHDSSDEEDNSPGCDAELEAQKDASHIATFDPPTVLALLDRLEAAETALDRVSLLDGEWHDAEKITREYFDANPGATRKQYPDAGERKP